MALLERTLEIRWGQRKTIEIEFEKAQQLFFIHIFLDAVFVEKGLECFVHRRTVHLMLVFSLRNPYQVYKEIFPRAFQIIIESRHRQALLKKKIL